MLAKRILVYSLIGLVIGCVFSVANMYLPLFHKTELSLYNTRFEVFRGKRNFAQDIVVLAIDELSIEEVGTYPWKRDVVAQTLDKIVNYGAKMVAVDVMYATDSNFPAADLALQSVLEKHRDKIVVVSKFDTGSTSRVTGTGADSEEEVQAMEVASYTPPIFEGSVDFGFANLKEDVDGQIRRANILWDLSIDDLLPTDMTVDKKYEPSFAFKTLEKTNPDKAKQVWDTYQSNDIWINFAGGPKTYKTISFYLPYFIGKQGFGPADFKQLVEESPEQFFKDKIVFVGATAEVLQDNKNTPFVANSTTKLPGVEVHANVFDTLREGIAYQKAEPWLNIALILALSVVSAIGLAFVSPLGGVALVLLLIVGYSVGNIFAFHMERLFIDWFAPMASVFCVYAATYAYRFFIEEKEKRRVRKFFKSYVSPNLVEELLKNPDTMPSLKSERRMVSILFSDIAGFTSMSESLPPDEVEHILNEYLTAMSEIVFDNDGTLDKYIGDAVMALWGNVGSSNPKTDAYKAVNTAIQMQRKLIELREKWLSEGMVPLQIRIGINTGEALVGNFGSPQKMDYTVIGDAVNTAARLEGLNKQFGSSILISQNCYELISDRINVRHCGSVKVKGKEEAVSVYEVLGWKDDSAAQTEVRETKWIKGSSETQWK